jgi:hypothetical protein
MPEYAPFLALAAVVTVVGSLLLFALRREGRRRQSGR